MVVSLAVGIALVVGFVLGYAARAAISAHRRRKALRREVWGVAAQTHVRRCAGGSRLVALSGRALALARRRRPLHRPRHRGPSGGGSPAELPRGRKRESARRGAEGSVQRSQLSMRPPRVNAVLRGEKLPLKSICACVFRHKSTTLPQITRISLKGFTRIQVRAAPDASAFIKNQGRIQGSGWRAASKLLSPDREGSGRRAVSKLLSPDKGRAGLATGPLHVSHHRAEIRREGS